MAPTDPSAIGQKGHVGRAVLVTVHGTWAAGAPWTKADSTLARAVVQWFAGRGVTASVVPFLWSGRNSVAARRTAGISLAEFVEKIRRDDPRASLYVIAHSHGGSVFAYATKQRPEIVDKIDGFIALATPWVGMETCSYAAVLRQMLVKLTLYAAIATILVALALMVFWYYEASAAPAVARAEQSASVPLQPDGATAHGDSGPGSSSLYRGWRILSRRSTW